VSAYDRLLSGEQDLENQLEDLREQLTQTEAVRDAVRRLIHTNECSDEGGWFAFWQPREGEDFDALFAERVNGCATEAEAVARFLEKVRSRR
jgi:hypothetical protein